MFGELFDALKVGFGIGITVGIIALIAGILKGIKDNKEAEEHRKWEQQRRREDINRIKDASKHWTRGHKMYFMQEVAKEYNRLAECQRKPVGQGYACKTIIMANIDGDLQMISMDLQGLNEVYSYLKGML